MGRKPKIIETEFTDGDETPRVDSLNLDEIFEDCGGDTGAQITGRVYRVNSPKDSLGRPTFEAIAKINKVVDEDWLGRNFGGGQYHIKYKVVRDGLKGEKQLNYNVGPEYNKYLTIEKNDLLGHSYKKITATRCLNTPPLGFSSFSVVVFYLRKIMFFNIPP